MLIAAQIRAARALLGWNGAALAEAAGVSLQTIRRMESEVGPGRSSAANVGAVQRALEAAGVTFLDADETTATGPGVRLKQSRD
ncbi:MAG: helix-turn-helix domain-containing protein [Brevundimonas sp.]|uniref:helix-turn-helix domain-containing protein n=1 Tax=Brevundimonas sp. TaxID=1871086 RepID=UPI00271C9EEC|nr:helix-turn-helix domain-containing protein [Brevundimonas sp.]MDO9609873.1 helix-turn-helix domain-containing protein [Brevundimonas sp.]